MLVRTPRRRVSSGQDPATVIAPIEMRKLFSTYVFPRAPVQAARTALCVALGGGVACLALGIGDEGFQDGYMELAASIGRGEGFRFGPSEPIVLHRPPVYPLLLTPAAALPEALQRPALILLHGALIALAAAQTFALGRRWFGPRVAGWGVLLSITSPWLLATTKTTATSYVEVVLYLALAAWFVEWMLTADKQTPSLRQGAAAGLVSGLLTLTHASKLLTAGCLLVLVAANGLRRGALRPALSVGFALFVMAVTIAPWTYRNWLVSDRFVPVATNAGYSYFAGNAHWGVTAPMQGPQETWEAAALRHGGVEARPEDVGRFWGLHSAELNESLDRRMSEHVRENPGAFAKKLACNAAEYYFPIVHPIYAKLHGNSQAPWKQVLLSSKSIDWGLVSLYHLALLSAAALGLSLGSQAGDRRAAWLLVVVIAAYAFPYFPFLVKAGFARYAMPTLPFLSLLAARCCVLWPAKEPAE